MDETLLKDSPAWINASVACRETFKADMANKRYGATETLDAWLWFRTGWLAFRERALAGSELC